MRHAQRYALAAEISAVALAGDLANGVLKPGDMVTLEVGNLGVPGVIDGSYRPPGFARIPKGALEVARRFCRTHKVKLQVQPRRSTPGLRRADSRACQRLWRFRRIHKVGRCDMARSSFLLDRKLVFSAPPIDSAQKALLLPCSVTKKQQMSCLRACLPHILASSQELVN